MDFKWCSNLWEPKSPRCLDRPAAIRKTVNFIENWIWESVFELMWHWKITWIYLYLCMFANAFGCYHSSCRKSCQQTRKLSQINRSRSFPIISSSKWKRISLIWYHIVIYKLYHVTYVSNGLSYKNYRISILSGKSFFLTFAASKFWWCDHKHTWFYQLIMSRDILINTIMWW